MSRDWRLYLSDLIQFCERVLEYRANLTRADFEADRMRYDAVLRNLELIGEAVRYLPSDLTAADPVAGNCGAP
jgi:uncharacterized protein with HEPN domain